MPLIHDPPRQVVPRWRPFEQTLARGELLPTAPLVAPRFTEEAVESQLYDWKDHQSLSIAADLVSVAFTLGLNSVALDAAEFLWRHGEAPPTARSLAATYLKAAGIDLPNEQDFGSLDEIIGVPDPLTHADRVHIAAIHRLRARLSVYARNAIDWTTLALHYTSLGSIEKATRAVSVALGLAPQNRFVLRAASRFFLHIGEHDRAHKLLSRSGIVRTDPWILAAEIATADAIRRDSSFTKLGKKALEAGRFNDRQASELASAVGTLEFKAGNEKKGRKIIDVSLREPSENAIAQAAWIARTISNRVEVPQSESSAEATAWTTLADGSWERSLEESDKWQADQPFSSRPAAHGSFIASTVFEDFEKTMDLARSGLRSNPDDVTLLNNCAFAAAMRGEIELAKEFMAKVPDRGSKELPSIAAIATRGLIAFRSGSPEKGRILYRLAIETARAAGQLQHEAQAKVYLAMEEVRAGSPDAVQLCRDAIQAARSLHTPLGRVLVGLVEKHSEHLTTEGQEKRSSTHMPLPVERPPV
jgi:tetratricopeptide (TPR) repeat protein